MAFGAVCLWVLSVEEVKGDWTAQASESDRSRSTGFGDCRFKLLDFFVGLEGPARCEVYEV